MSSTSRRWLVLLIWIAAILSILAIGLTIYVWQSGLFVVVQNHQSTPARNVVVYFNGGRIEFGNLAPDEVRREKIHPNDGTRIEIEFTDDSGKRDRHSFEHNFQPDYQGELEFRLLDGAVGCANLTEPS